MGRTRFWSMTSSRVQLRLVWPEHRLDAPPVVQLPPGYALRVWQPDDTPAFYRLMARAGWPGWDDERLRPWLPRILPDGWFLVVHTASGGIVATAMALRDCAEFGQPGGELGWVAADPEHRGRGLGLAVSAAATARLIQAGFRYIHLYTEPWRLPALKTYRKLGYAPLPDGPEAKEQWRAVCTRMGWSLVPEKHHVQHRIHPKCPG